MLGILGNGLGIVKPKYLPFDFVFCRISVRGHLKTIIIRNKTVKNIYGLPVKIFKNKIIGIQKTNE